MVQNIWCLILAVVEGTEIASRAIFLVCGHTHSQCTLTISISPVYKNHDI